MADNLLTFEERKRAKVLGGKYYTVLNRECQYLGYIEKRRMGRFLHWCFLTTSAGEVLFSIGRLKEISAFITKLARTARAGRRSKCAS